MSGAKYFLCFLFLNQSIAFVCVRGRRRTLPGVTPSNCRLHRSASAAASSAAAAATRHRHLQQLPRAGGCSSPLCQGCGGLQQQLTSTAPSTPTGKRSPPKDQSLSRGLMLASICRFGACLNDSRQCQLPIDNPRVNPTSLCLLH